MITVGITGGIGSGKTTVCRIFEFLHVPVYYADLRARQLMTDHPELVADIIHEFGKEAYQSDGSLNREYLANEVFGNEERLRKLNSLVHPRVWEDSANWFRKHSGHAYVLYEAAILFESGSYKMLDKTIHVSAPEDVRIDRVMNRDNVSGQDVKARMKHQMKEEEKAARADYIINNDGKHSIIVQVLAIHKELLALSDS